MSIIMLDIDFDNTKALTRLAAAAAIFSKSSAMLFLFFHQWAYFVYVVKHINLKRQHANNFLGQRQVSGIIKVQGSLAWCISLHQTL